MSIPGDTCTRMFVTVLLKIAKTGPNPNVYQQNKQFTVYTHSELHTAKRTIGICNNMNATQTCYLQESQKQKILKNKQNESVVRRLLMY